MYDCLSYATVEQRIGTAGRKQDEANPQVEKNLQEPDRVRSILGTSEVYTALYRL